MKDSDEPKRDYFGRVDSFRVDNAEDAELAFKLQNSARNDPDLLRSMIQRYTGDLYRWIEVQLYFQQNASPTHEAILAILQQVFKKAITHLEQFHEQANVFTWLFSITYQTIARHSLWDWIHHQIQRNPPDDSENIPNSAIYWSTLPNLAEKLRTPLILRYLFNLGLVDIGAILNLQVGEVHQRLVLGRKRMMLLSSPTHLDAQLQAYVDGVLDDNPEVLGQFMQHLETCALCRSSMQMINNFEKSLGEYLQKQWESKTLAEQELEVLIQSVLLISQQPDARWKPQINVRQIGWMVGLSIVFVGLAFLFIRLTPVEREFPKVEATATSPLPNIINMLPEMDSSSGDGKIVQAPHYINPAFSSDGKWAVFSLITYNSNIEAMSLPTIEVYNREANTIQVISESTATVRLPWVWWDLAPSISADGHRIVYVSSSDDQNITGDPCTTADQHSCLDIFLYEQDTRSIKRITQAGNGGPADGDSLAPTISADGQWVAFWSAADNLVAGDNDDCQSGKTDITCLYIYLYNIQSHEMIRLPMRYFPGDMVFALDRISLSADGRYIGFTATPAFQARNMSIEGPLSSGLVENLPGGTGLDTAPLVINQSNEAVVYDQQAGSFELVNQTEDGTIGNGSSSSPVISTDGRYVAFASASSNLVRGDSNQHVDVFVRDRQTGKVELASLASNGIQGYENSGLTLWERGFYSINISSDGRYIAFESKATNLDASKLAKCSRVTAIFCNILYLHDRQTGQTELIPTTANQEFSLFPEISADGRFLTFMQFLYNCNQTQFYCSNAMMYDRQRGWMTNLTGYGERSAPLPWSYSTSLALPQGTWESKALAFSTDGKLIALGGSDSRVRIWHIPNGIESVNQKNPDTVFKTDANDAFTALAVSQDNRWLAAGTTKGIVYVWELSGGKNLYTLKDQINPINKIVFSQDGTRLIISTLYDTWIWIIGDGMLIKENEISLGESAGFALDIANSGNMLAAAHGDGTVWLQNLPSGEVIGRLGGQQLAANSLTFSVDGSLLATRSPEGRINLWKIGAGNSEFPAFVLLNTLQSTAYTGVLAFSPDNKYLVLNGTIGEVILWRVPDGKIYRIASYGPYEGMVYGVAFSKEGDALAAVFGNELALFEISPGLKSNYFIHSAEDTYLDSPPLPPATANDIPALNHNNYPASMLSLDQAAALLHFPLEVPSHLPENLDFLGATVNEDGSAWLRFVTYDQQSYQSILYIYERAIDGSAPPTMTIGASAVVIPIRIDGDSGKVNAEYIQGDWVQSRGFVLPGDNSLSAQTIEVWQWHNSSGSQRLRWLQGSGGEEILIALYYQANDNYIRLLQPPGSDDQPAKISPFLRQDDLVQIATGMVNFLNLKVVNCGTTNAWELYLMSLKYSMNGWSCSLASK